MTYMTNRSIVHSLAVLLALSLLSACKQADESTTNFDTNAPIQSGPDDNNSQPPASVFEPIQINAAPQDIFGYPGQTVQFQVQASSNIALAYQWFHNDSPLANSNSPTLGLIISDSSVAGTYRVEISNASTRESASADLSIGALPTISSQPALVAVYPGDSASLSVTASGTDLAYQWQQNINGSWTTIRNATARSLLITNADATKATEYRVIVSNDGGSVTSNIGRVTLKNPVIITQNPAPQQVVVGQNASFSVAASGHGTLRYRWYKGNYAIYDGSKYSGTTSTTLTVKNTGTGDASLYRVKVSNNDNKYAFSEFSQLSVAGPAKVTLQPVNTTLYASQSGSLVIGASGDQPMRFQWQKWNNGSWQNVSGATSATLSFSNVSSAHAGRYRCQVSNAVATDTSAEATVTVLAGVTITTSPASRTVNSGESAQFTVVATGDNLQYEWTKNGERLANTGNTLSFAAAREVDEATYGCRVYNGGSSANCRSFSLTVNSPLAITQQPVSQNTYEGGSVTLTAAASGDPAPTLEWYFGANLVGTGNSLTINNIAASQAGEYRCVAKNTTGSVNCNPVTISVSQSVKILGQPAATTVVEGNPLTLTLSASGEALSYDWSRNGVSLGINSPTLSFATIRAADEGTYSCRIWNGSSSANCNAFTVTVNQGVRIATQPVAASAFEDASVTLSVSATGKPTPSVNWYRNGTLVRSNATTLTLSSLQMADAGSYHCVVRNSVNSVNCNAVNVTVREKVRITKPLANQTLNEGDAIALDLAATGEAPINYQCYHNGTAVVAGTSPGSLVIPNAQAADAGNYHCVVSNAGSRVTSNTASVSVVSSVVTRSALLTWTAPTTRANGERLSSSEIAGYEIYMATDRNGPFDSVITTEGNTTRAQINDLTAGTYYFGITTLDNHGLESEMSEVFSLVIR